MVKNFLIDASILSLLSLCVWLIFFWFASSIALFWFCRAFLLSFYSSQLANFLSIILMFNCLLIEKKWFFLWLIFTMFSSNKNEFVQFYCCCCWCIKIIILHFNCDSHCIIYCSNELQFYHHWMVKCNHFFTVNHPRIYQWWPKKNIQPHTMCILNVCFSKITATTTTERCNIRESSSRIYIVLQNKTKQVRKDGQIKIYARIIQILFHSIFGLIILCVPLIICFWFFLFPTFGILIHFLKIVPDYDCFIWYMVSISVCIIIIHKTWI